MPSPALRSVSGRVLSGRLRRSSDILCSSLPRVFGQNSLNEWAYPGTGIGVFSDANAVQSFGWSNVKQCARRNNPGFVRKSFLVCLVIPDCRHTCLFGILHKTVRSREVSNQVQSWFKSENQDRSGLSKETCSTNRYYSPGSISGC